MYRLQEQIGKGGYSHVYKCVDHVGVRYVAKEMPKDRNKRIRVKNEIDFLKQLLPVTRVARYVDAFENNDNFYIIQEWCKGGDIKSYVGLHQSYGENTIASIIRGTLRGLHHVHRQGIIHMDIKAGNVLFADTNQDAEIKLVDFGAALVGGCGLDLIEFPSKRLICTPWFVAPEVLGCKASYRSDLWSVGVLTYLLLCGNLPFNDIENPVKPDMHKIFRSIFQDEPSFTRSIWKDISPEAKYFITKCLEKDIEHRWKSAEEALEHEWLRSTDCTDRFSGQPLVGCMPFQYEDFSGMVARSMPLNAL